ncbi:Anion-transporting ATPase-like domain protein [Gemmatirosa kalamazoonensis]|uniref:arsenite-transporting ATPase n=1 Tax=Gemmatirosa kalamazoonensis TaxID=861299 RepID=W0RBJ6_9BACT|nr:Anion-transporting ATPase-like domain protein [Gemmatirosa kalamazoonensis]
MGLRAATRAPTLLLSTDPAGTLGDVLGAGPLSAEPARVADGLDALQLDAAAHRAAFLARWRAVLVTIIDRGTYLDRDDIEPLVDATFPGADEIFAVLHLGELLHDARWSRYERLVVDTAPTGHTLRLLELPRTFDALLALLEAMQEKHRFMVRALVHRYRADAADAFLRDMRARATALRDALRDPARTAAVVVTRDEPVVAAETARLVRALGEREIAVAAIVVNAAEGEPDVPNAFVVPRLDPPRGVDGLRAWAEAMHEHEPQRTRRTQRKPLEGFSSASSASSAVQLEALVRPLTVVAGKGGVGKTTVACALAVATAAPDRPTLLVSTDPAPSVGDALGIDVPDAETPVPGVPGLAARQMDAGAAFARLVASYQERIDEVFGGLVSHGVDAAHDRAIVRELLALAPPGVDELYALAELGATLEEGRWAQVIVDPAPTGHLLRLLEMPALALGWTHQLMRLILKYREVGGLAEAGEELLRFARRTRALGAMLGDAARAGVLVVTLDEPVVRAESARLIDAVRARGMDVVGVLRNRAAAPGPDMSAPAVPGLLGVDALRAWAARWTIAVRDRD